MENRDEHNLQRPDGFSGMGASHDPIPTKIRARVIFIGFGGVISLTLFVQWSDMQVGGTMSAGPFPPLAACLQGGLLLAVNALLTRLQGGRSPFKRRELLFIWAMWVAANMVAGRGLLHPFLISLVGPTYFERTGILAKAAAKGLPSWLAVTNRTAAGGFFEGYNLPVPWSDWWRPLGTWACFFASFLTANICLCALFERVWVRNERLSFPLVALPLEGVTGNRANYVRHGICYGLAIPVLLHGLGAAHAYLPAVPSIPLSNDFSAFVTDPNLSSLRPLYLNIYPLLIGLTFLAPAEVAFSIWFFLLLNKVQLIATAMGGWNDGASNGGMLATFPYIEEQSAGAYLMLGGMLIWNARTHLCKIVTAMWPFARRRSLDLQDYREYRLLAWGFLAGVGGTLAWCLWTGLPLWFSCAFFGFYLIVAIVLGRLMAEGGVSWILAPIMPDKLILSLTGSDTLSQTTVARLVLHAFHLRDTRQMLAPTIFEMGKIRDTTGFPLRGFYGLLLGSVLLALIAGSIRSLSTIYTYGLFRLSPNSDGLKLSTWIVYSVALGHGRARLLQPIKPTSGVWIALLIGASITWVLSCLRLRCLWWPLHPLGYALTGTMQTGYANKMLFSIFLGWLFKVFTLRWGGARGFRILRGVALGLILGDLIMGGVLKLLDALLGPSDYAIF